MSTDFGANAPLVLLDCDNIAAQFWPAIVPILAPSCRIIGAGVAQSLVQWRPLLPHAALTEVPPGKDLADLYLFSAAQAAHEAGVRDFLVCSSDAELWDMIHSLRVDAARVRQVRILYGVPMLRQLDHAPEPLVVPGMPRKVFDAIVLARALHCTGAGRMSVHIHRVFMAAQGMGYQHPFATFVQGLSQLGCVAFSKGRVELDPLYVSMTGRPSIRVPSGTCYVG